MNAVRVCLVCGRDKAHTVQLSRPGQSVIFTVLLCKDCACDSFRIAEALRRCGG